MITRDEARVIAGLKEHEVQEALDACDKAIRKAAAAGRTEVLMRSPRLLERGGYANDPKWLEVKAALEAAGFTVTFHYEERQFVDMATKITWSN